MQTMASDFQNSVGSIVETVSSAATELEASSQTMAQTAEQTSHQASTVASASEEMNVNVQPWRRPRMSCPVPSVRLVVAYRNPAVFRKPRQ